jgi:hypothetical protein
MQLGPGVQVGSPTGGDKGTGTINAQGAYYANGTVGVTATPTLPLTAFATTTGLATTVTGTSDERLKDWAPYGAGLDALLKIEPIRYRWNRIAQDYGIDGEQEQFGFRAQNVQTALPEAITAEQWRNGQVWYAIKERAISGAVVNAIKELHARLTALEATA